MEVPAVVFGACLIACGPRAQPAVSPARPSPSPPPSASLADARASSEPAALSGRIECYRGAAPIQLVAGRTVIDRALHARRAVDIADGRGTVSLDLMDERAGTKTRTVTTLDIGTGAVTEWHAYLAGVGSYAVGNGRTRDGSDRVFELVDVSSRRVGTFSAIIFGKLYIRSVYIDDLRAADAVGLNPARGAQALETLEALMTGSRPVDVPVAATSVGELDAVACDAT